MCTALLHQSFFGRTLDLEYSYQEQVVVVPRRFPLPFRTENTLPDHYAMIGMAHVQDNFPLFYDGMNEMGLAMAGLNFPHSAVYQTRQDGRLNLAPFEVIPRVLGQCATVAQARQLLEQTNVVTLDFSPRLPSTPLHWIVADRNSSLAVEPMADGLHLHENPAGVLTNEPPFPFQLARLNDFPALSPYPPKNHFSPVLPLTPPSRGMGALGLPGDWSSRSRFVRCAFAAHNSSVPCDVNQFFHLMSTVEVPRGCVRLEDGNEVTSIYTSCCDLSTGVYHYVTYTNRQICAVALHRCDLEGHNLSRYPLMIHSSTRYQN